jgi:hypothetical protein
MFLGSGAIAQLGERLLCKQEVVGSIPTGSTIPCRANVTHSFHGLANAPCLLFKNPREVLFLTLSFQAKDIVFNSLENVAFAM